MKFFLSKTEQAILNLLWKNQRWMSGVEFWKYFNSNGKPCKRQTINTYLTRMTDKGILVKNERKYMYTYKKEEWDQRKANEIITTMFDNSLKNFIVAITGSRKLSKKEAEELKEYLSQIEENNP